MLWILSHLDNSESVSIYGGERAISNFEMIFLWDIFSSLKLQFSVYRRRANFSIPASHCLLNLAYIGAFVFKLKLLLFLWGMSLILGEKKKSWFTLYISIFYSKSLSWTETSENPRMQQLFIFVCAKELEKKNNVKEQSQARTSDS